MGLFLFLTLPLFFYNLGAYSLVDFDEAWYAEIAKNILKFHQPFLLSFNGQSYLDHPPLGFNLIALSFRLFGGSEFAARLPSAVLGFGAVLLVYFIGKSLFNRWVGLSAAAMLASSVWFVFRAREADLDSPFLFFLLLTVFAAAQVKRDPRWLYLLALALAAALQVKSAIGLTVFPAVLILLFLARQKLDWRRVVLALALFLAALLPWLVSNWLVFGQAFLNRYLAIGLRSSYQTVFSPTTLTYLHSGIGKWYYPALLSLPASLFFIRRWPQLLALLSTTAVLLFGFLTNQKTEIWHLLPLYPFLFLILSAVIFSVGRLQIFLIALVILISAYQIYGFRYNIRLTDQGNSDLVKVSKASRGRDEPLYLDGQDFFPTTVFYSQKQVTLDKNAFLPPDNNLVGLVARGQRPFLLITEDWRLSADKIDARNYQLLSQSGSWVLIMLK